MDLNAAMSTLVSVVGILLLLMYKRMEARLDSLEKGHEPKDSAHAQRKELKEAIEDHAERDEKQWHSIENILRDMKHETTSKRDEARLDLSSFRVEMGARVETVRTETNSRLDATNVKIDGLVNQIGALALLQVRRKGAD